MRERKYIGQLKTINLDSGQVRSGPKVLFAAEKDKHPLSLSVSIPSGHGICTAMDRTPVPLLSQPVNPRYTFPLQLHSCCFLSRGRCRSEVHILQPLPSHLEDEWTGFKKQSVLSFIGTKLDIIEQILKTVGFYRILMRAIHKTAHLFCLPNQRTHSSVFV